jgi:hypothetical protein
VADSPRTVKGDRFLTNGAATVLPLPHTVKLPKRGARKWGQKNGINPDRAEDRFHGIKQGDSGPASGAADALSVNPDTGEVFDANGEHIGNLNDKG